jgi:hypothetical protein
VRKEQQRTLRDRQPLERFQGDGGEWHGPGAAPRFRRLDLAAHELSTDVYDAAVAVDVAPLETHQLGRAKTGRGCEHDHRASNRAELIGHGVDLAPRFERPLLWEATQRV